MCVEFVRVCVRACVRVSECVTVSISVCVCACVCVCVCVVWRVIYSWWLQLCVSCTSGTWLSYLAVSPVGDQIVLVTHNAQRCTHHCALWVVVMRQQLLLVKKGQSFLLSLSLSVCLSVSLSLSITFQLLYWHDKNLFVFPDDSLCSPLLRSLRSLLLRATV